MSSAERVSSTGLKGAALARQLAWQGLSAFSAGDVASRVGVSTVCSPSVLEVPFLGQTLTIDLAASKIVASGQPLNLLEEALVLRCLWRCDGTPVENRWISFRELPGAMSYVVPFAGRTSRRLAARFGADRPSFERASAALGGEALEYGDASFAYRLLPPVRLAVVLHLADDEFPSEVTLLFDASLARQLTPDDCAAAGQVLTSRLLRAAACDSEA